MKFYKKNIKIKSNKILALFIAISLCFSFVIQASALESDAPSLKAQNGAILITADTGEVVFEQDADMQASMASTTKIMSTMLALESGNLDEQFVVDSQAIKVEGSSMGLVDGDQVTMRDLCYGMILPSGNDAANAAAVKIAGSINDFVEMMNKRAKEIGMKSTMFATPSGLDDNVEHYSCARDMAILAREAMKNPTFCEICKQSSQSLNFGNPPYKRTLYNHNKMMSFYPGSCGVKTGFTSKAGRCLVSAAERDGVKLIAVVLHDSADWNDSAALFDYGFTKVKKVSLPVEVKDISLPVIGGKVKNIGVTAGIAPSFALTQKQIDSVQTTVKTDPFYYAPIETGQKIGELVYTLDGKNMGTTDLFAGEDVSKEKTGGLAMWFNSQYAQLKLSHSLFSLFN